MAVTHAVGNAESSGSQMVETSSRMEEVLVPRKRGTEEMVPLDDGLREMATSLMSLSVAPVNFNVAELLRRKRFSDAVFEHGLAVGHATVWDMEDEEQMKEGERRVMEEELVLLIASPMCCSFGKLIELARVTDKLDEVKQEHLLERCVRHHTFCFTMLEVQRDAGRWPVGDMIVGSQLCHKDE